MRFALTSFVATALLALTLSASSAEPPDVAELRVDRPHAVVELFTSQGCSSCPPANTLLSRLAKDKQVLALSYSVDYWDYLGWKDTFGKSEFTNRQRKYGEHLGGQVYTPQFVINGARHANTFADRDIHTHDLVVHPEIQVTATGHKVKVRIHPAETLKTRLNITAVRYVPGPQEVPVKAGENRGRLLSLFNVVTDCKELGKTRKEFSKTIAAPKAGEALAILVQDGAGGKILSATRILSQD